MDNRERVDVLIKNGCVITVDSQRRVIEDGAVAVKGERIVAVGDTSALASQYCADRVIDARRKAVLPGLIDAHTHAGHAMLRTNPSAIISIIGRCPVPELIDARVNVAIASDGRVLTVDEGEILERVTAAAEQTLERSGLRHLLDAPSTLWRRSHY
ncbi:hypothetical protein PQR64_15150 [Paraburkholderia phytofirmans]|uniref:amidohydrolase family protein n=1 Tax=Paraburkholderia phytofirmans TaxID=261302 RepID=UPI0038B99695